MRTWGAQNVISLCQFARRLGRDTELDLADLAERHLQEAGADLAERLHRAGAEELVVALLVALLLFVPGVAVTTDDLLGWTRPRLASYKKPRRIVFVSELPIGPTGKVLKRDLREELWRDHDRQVG